MSGAPFSLPQMSVIWRISGAVLAIIVPLKIEMILIDWGNW